jgi:hypothetical protein
LTIFDAKLVVLHITPMRELPRARTELADAEAQYRSTRA